MPTGGTRLEMKTFHVPQSVYQGSWMDEKLIEQTCITHYNSLRVIRLEVLGQNVLIRRKYEWQFFLVIIKLLYFERVIK